MSQEELAHLAKSLARFYRQSGDGEKFSLRASDTQDLLLALKIEPWKLFLDPQKQDMFFTRDEVFQWWKDSVNDCWGFLPNRPKRRAIRACQDETPAQD